MADSTISQTKSEEKWFSLPVAEVETKLGTSVSQGLSSTEAQKRLAQYGPNELQQEKKRARWKDFLDEFTDPLVIILIAAAVISVVVQFFGTEEEPDFTDAIVIAAIVILNAIIGFLQEGKADAALEALKSISAPEAVVIRDGKEQKIKAVGLIPGDVVLLAEGDKVPADGRLIDASNLKIEEAALTGESVPVSKKIDLITDLETALADRKNMVFASTLATFGRGKYLVTETAMKTEVGKIATMISEAEEKITPLQKSLDDFGKFLGKLILVICAVVVLLYGFEVDQSCTSPECLTTHWLFSLMNGIALAVAAIPEGLPAIVTTCLAIGVTKMAHKNAIIKKLHSVETLGCTTVICSDKTGTLTKNEMTVRSIWAGGKFYAVSGSGYAPEGKFALESNEVQPLQNPDLEITLRCGLLCNNARLSQDERTKKWNTLGDPTEGCLITSAWKAGLERGATYKKFPRVDEIPFDSSRKRMSTINKVDGKKIAYIKGATEILLDFTTHIQMNGSVRPITEADKQMIITANNARASEALRGLGFAFRLADGVAVEIDALEKDLTFVGMQFMIDPPRTEVRDAIKLCRESGIAVKMITGDNLLTAQAIAEELDIIPKGGHACEGKHIPQMNDDDILNCNVFARVSPEHKQNIVKALQNKGQVVAMTGDGVNDAPALKNANVGVAMGITGTEVSKEAAHMVLADDNFATIVNAVEEGRGIYDNIKKFIQYLLSSNVMEILVLLVAAILQNPPPLIPVQLLWINLVTDGAPALALGFDPYDPLLMKQKPRPIKEPIVNRNFLITMLYRGVIFTIIVLGLFELYDNGAFMPTVVPPEFEALVHKFTTEAITTPEQLLHWFQIWKARSVTFLVMMFSEMANAYNCRSEYNSVFKIGFFTNKVMLGAVGISAVLTVLLYVPGLGMGELFKVIPLGIEWLWVPFAIVIVIGAVEILKILFRRKLKLSLVKPQEIEY